jgi:hypothetical protein
LWPAQANLVLWIWALRGEPRRQHSWTGKPILAGDGRNGAGGGSLGSCPNYRLNLFRLKPHRRAIWNGRVAWWDRSLNQGQFRSFEEGHPQSAVSFVSFKSAPAKPSCSLSPSFGAQSLFIRFACGQSQMSRRGTHLGRLYLRPGKRMFNSPKSTPLLQPWSWTIAPVVECEARMSFQRRQAPVSGVSASIADSRPRSKSRRSQMDDAATRA